MLTAILQLGILGAVGVVSVVVLVASRRFGGAFVNLAAMPAMAAANATVGTTYQAGTIAQRLGLSIASGAATDDLMMMPVHLLAPPGRGQTVERSVRLEGTPRGRPIEVVDFVRKTHTPDGWASARGTIQTWQDLHIAVQLRVRVPQFEIVSKRSTLGEAQGRELALPLVTAGAPALDSEFAFAGDARAIAEIAPVLAQLDGSLRAYGVRVVCSGDSLRFAFDRGRFGPSMYYAEQLVWALEQMADRLERAPSLRSA